MPKKDDRVDLGDCYQIEADGTRVVQLRPSALSPLFPFNERHFAAAEQYRIIRTRIVHSPKRPRLIVISSASIGDGKTVTAINTAASLALMDDSRVLLIDGDLRCPRVSSALGVPAAPGLTQVLAGVVEFESALVRTCEFPNLFLLPSDSSAGNPAEMLDSQRWRLLLEQVRTRFSSVIIDAPPIASVADYELLQLFCDGVVVVVRQDHTQLPACVSALSVVPPDKLLGVVLNCVEDWWLWKTPGYGYYQTGADTQALVRREECRPKPRHSKKSDRKSIRRYVWR